MKILVQAVELDGVPAHADAEPEPSPGEHVQRRRLLGDQHGLALRQNQDLGGKFQFLRAGAQETEQHEWIMKKVLGRVAVSPVLAARHIDAEHVIGGGEVVIAEVFRSLREIAYRRGVAFDIDQRQRNAKLHTCLPGQPARKRKPDFA